MKNNFLLDPEKYKQHLNPLQDWMKQVAWYASKMQNKDYQQCLAHLQKKIKLGEVKIADPLVTFFNRDENGDRVKDSLPLTRYLGQAVKTGRSLLLPERPISTQMKKLR